MWICENGPGVTADTWPMVDAKLGEIRSPEQGSGYLKANGQPTVSHKNLLADLC
jgi:hypothetical protein